MVASEWAVERFGVLADGLLETVPSALKRAHESAVAAQGASGTRHRDPYGHTLKNRQHECLVEALEGLEGVQRFQPHGASFELVRLTATRVSLLPWRYGTNRAASRLKVRMKPSGLRRDLLSGPAGNPNQLSLEQAELPEAELEAQLAENDAVWEQLRSLARVVTIAYSSDPSGIFDLGWGDVELLDEDGTLKWLHWEPLLLADSAAGGGERRRHLQEVKRSAVGTPSTDSRFDDAAGLDDDDLPMRARPSMGEPKREAEPNAEETGTDGPTDEPS